MSTTPTHDAPRRPDVEPSERPPSSRLVRPGRIAMWTALLCYSVTALLARDPAFARAVTVLGLALVWLPTTVAALAARRGTTPGARTATAALGAFTLGLTLNGLELVLTGVVHFPSWGDPGYLAFYVLLPLALHRSSRGRIGRLSPVTVLDGLVAALGVAAVLSVPLTLPLERAHERIDLAAVIALSYPLLDLLVVGVLVWLVAVNAGALPGWPWLVGGLLLLAASDTAFAVVASDVLDLLAGAAQLGWVLGLAATSEWVVRLARAPASAPRASPLPADREIRRVATTAALSAGWASLAVLVVLLLAARGELPNETIVLAALMVVASAIRTQIGFRLLLITRRLQAQALTDELTGLPNRRALRAEAARVLGAGPGAQHAVLVLDLDGFKDVNDTQGHGAGDAVLAEVATRIAGSVRQSDLVARTGGDEFVVLMPGADRGTALDVARRISEKVDRPIVVGTTTTHVTTSVGVALYPAHGEDMSTLVLRADRAMYAAKAGGSSVRVAEVPVRVADTAVRVADDHDGANASA